MQSNNKEKKMSYVYGYDANTASLEMWHRAQEQAEQEREEMAGNIADSLRDSAKKMLLLANQIESGISTLDLDHAGEHTDWIADSVKALWGDKNA
jgi:hypothetical protein